MPTRPTSDPFATAYDLVIVGHGYAAMVDAATRWATGKLFPRTLLVGEGDPWGAFVDHKMGQFPALLSLPGYRRAHQHRSADQADFLPSKSFATANSEQLGVLLGHAGVEVVEGTVFAPLEEAGGQYSIRVKAAGGTGVVRADRVDVCSGPGKARRFDPRLPRQFGPWVEDVSTRFDAALLDAFDNNDTSHACSAHEFMMAKGGGKGNALIVGEGPLAASCVERFLEVSDLASTITWVGRPDNMTRVSFPESLRYDPLVRDANGVREWHKQFEKATAYGKTEPPIDALWRALAPAHPRVTIVPGMIDAIGRAGRGWRATCVQEGRFALAALAYAPPAPPTAVTTLPVDFDFMVVSASSETRSDERGSASFLVSAIREGQPDRYLRPIEALGMFVGLTTVDGRFRVLGNPSRNRNLWTAHNDPPHRRVDRRYKRWHASLCGQARMPDALMGITSGAAAIAMANGFYDDSRSGRDRCCNTAIDREIGRERRDRVPPYGAQGAKDVLDGYDVFPRPA